MKGSLLVMEKVNQRFSCFSLYARKRGFVVLLLVLVMGGFVVGSSYSEVETSFVIMSLEDVDSGLDFWGAYGNYLLAGVIVLVVIVVYLNAINGSGKKRRKKRRK